MLNDSHIIAIEQKMLSTLLRNTSLIYDLQKVAIDDSFFLAEEHQILYEALSQLIDSALPSDYHTILDILLKLEVGERMDPEAAFNTVWHTASDPESFHHHLQILVEQYLRRKSVAQLTDLMRQVVDDRTAIEDTLADGATSLQSLIQTRGRANLHTIEQLALNQFQRIQEIRLHPGLEAGIATGFRELDTVITGFLPGQLYVIGARPSVGKTTLMVNLLLNALFNPNRRGRALYYSLKTSAELLSQRMLSCMSGIMYQKISRGVLDEQELNQLYNWGVEPLANADLTINDSPLLRVADIRKQLQSSRDRPFEIVFIDQLQQILAGKGRYRDEEISNIMKELKRLSIEYNIPIVVSSQLNRIVDQRRSDNRMPQLSDLRDSGGIEQEADVVLFLYRPEYYDLNTSELGMSNKGETHIRVAKNRTGPLDTIRLRAMLHIQKFLDFDMDNQGLFDVFVPKDKNLSEHRWTERFEEERKRFSDPKMFDDEAPF